MKFAGWAFEPQVVEANVKRFMEQNPDIRVDYTPLDLQLYNEKMVALFNAGSQGDAFYIRDTNLGAWVEAGWVQPIDGMPGLKELNDDMFPFIREAMFYKGKQYGTPYYGDIYVYMYDKKALQQAGIAKAPSTLGELKDAALEIKKAGAVQYPILKGFKTNVDGLSEFWSMVFASGGRLFNEALDPVYPNEDKTALGVLEWLVEAMHGWKILDPRGLGAGRDPGARRLPQRPGHLHLERRQCHPAREQPSTEQARGRRSDDALPRVAGPRKGPDGMEPALWDQLRDEGQGCCLAPDLAISAARIQRASTSLPRIGI